MQLFHCTKMRILMVLITQFAQNFPLDQLSQVQSDILSVLMFILTCQQAQQFKYVHAFFPNTRLKKG